MSNVVSNWKHTTYFVLRTAGFPVQMLKSLQMKRTAELIERLPEITDWNEKAIQEIQTSFYKELEDNFKYIKELLSSNMKLREAIFYSNKSFYNLIDKIEYTDSSSLNRRLRERASKLDLYLQRFSAKNDTIDFYGPTTYGRFLETETSNIDLDWTEQQHRFKSSSFFTHRAIQALARSLAENPQVRLQIIPIINPTVYISEGLGLILRTFSQSVYTQDIFKEVKLDELDLRFIDIVKESISLRAIKDKLSDDYGVNISDIDKCIKKLESNDIVRLEFAIPTTEPNQLSYFINIVSTLNEFSGKTDYIKSLNDLNRLKKAYYAEDNMHNKEVIYKEVSDIYEKLTGVDAWLSQGKFYEERFIFYRDTHKRVNRFEVSNDLKSDFDNHIPIVLDLLLCVPNRLFYRYKQAILSTIRKHYKSGEKINLISFIHTLNGDKEFIREVESLERALPECINALFEDIISCSNNESDGIELSLKDIEEILLKYNKKPNSAFVSPDVLIASASQDEINKGNYKLILGEIHTNIRVMLTAIFSYDFDNKEGIIEDYEKCLATLSSHGELVTDMVRPDVGRHLRSIDHSTYNIECSGYSNNEEENKVRFSQLNVLISDDNVELLLPDEQRLCLAFIVPSFFEQTFLRGFSYPMWFGTAPFVKYNNRKYCPQISYRNIVIARESWRVSVDEIVSNFNKKAQPVNDMINMISYFQQSNLPFQFFGKFCSEPKVIYFDITNYLSVINFKKLIYSNIGSEVMLSKPAPDENELWVSDEQGNYCSEIRMIYYY